MRASCLAFSALLALCSAAEAAPDWNAVGQALGKNGTEMPGGVYRIGMPRSDLHVMGDLVLTEAEVNPVMKSLLDQGFEVTALHNHVFNARPATFYMHVGAMGDPVALAKSLRTALSLSGTPLANAAASPPPAIDLDTAAIDAALGAKGANAGGAYQVGVPRAEPILEMGSAIPNAMGVTEAINFQPLGGGRAAITGDFILIAKEVNPVIRALKKSGIDVTALHNHMLTEEPRMFFVHFWAADSLPKLLTGLKAAMAEVAVKR
jgi:biotin operon repressor